MKKEKLHIVHVVHQFLPRHRHGVELSTLELAREQQGNGHEVSIFAGERGYLHKELEVKDETYQGLAVSRVYFNPRHKNGYLHHNGLAKAFRKHIEKYSVQIVHIHHLNNLSFSIIDEAKKMGLPVVYSLRDYALVCSRINLIRGNGELCTQSDLEEDCLNCLKQSEKRTGKIRLNSFLWAIRKNILSWRAWQLALQVVIKKQQNVPPPITLKQTPDFALRNRRVLSAMNKVDQIISISNDTGWRLNRMLGNKLSIKTIHQAPDVRDRCTWIERPLRDGLVRIGYIGKFAKIKGIHVLLEAFSKFPELKSELHIFGSPGWTDPDSIGYWLESKDLFDREDIFIHENGFKANEISTVMAQFDVLVVPSIWYEAFGRIVVEALASGVPVICSDQGGPSETIEDGFNGLHFKMGDSEHLYKMLKKLIDQPEYLRSMSKNCQVPKSTEMYVKEIEDVYRDVLLNTDKSQ